MKESALKVKLPSPHDKSFGVQKTSIRVQQVPKEYVHLNKSELSKLQSMQGHNRTNKHGVADLSDLSPLFNHQPFLKDLYKHARSFHAAGGSIQSMASKGRKGDSIMAYMPSHVADHLDRCMGGRSINPQTQKREYFNFGNMLSNFGNAVKTAAPGVMSTLGSAAKAAAPALGQIAQAGAPLAAQYLQQKLNPQAAPQQPQAPGAPAAAPSAPGAAPGGFDMGSFMRSLSSNPQMQHLLGGLGSGLSGAYGAYNQGGNLQDILTQGGMGAIRGGTQGMDNPYARMANTGLDTYQRTGNMRDAAGQAALSGVGDFADKYGYGDIGRGARGMASAQQRGNGWGQSAISGAQAGIGNRNDMASRALRGGLDVASRGGGYGDMAGGAFNGAMSPYSGGAGPAPYRGTRQRAAPPVQRNSSGMVSPAGLWGNDEDF